MELKYIWIEEYKNLKGFETNFVNSSRQKFAYANNELIVKSEDKWVEGSFFGPNISGVTAIVGANGSGKSNLAEFIRLHVGHFNEGMMSGWLNRSKKAIIIIGNHIEIHKSIVLTNKNKLVQAGFNVKLYSEMPFEESFSNYQSTNRLRIPEFSLIYYSNSFDLRESYHLPNAFDVSTNYLLQGDADDFRFRKESSYHRQEEVNVVDRHYFLENNRIVDLIFENNLDFTFLEHLHTFDLCLNNSENNSHLSGINHSQKQPNEFDRRFSYYDSIEQDISRNIAKHVRDSIYKIDSLSIQFAFRQLFLLNILRAFEKRGRGARVYFSNKFIEAFLGVDHLAPKRSDSSGVKKVIKLRTLLKSFMSLVTWKDEEFTISYDQNLFKRNLALISKIEIEVKDKQQFKIIKEFVNELNSTLTRTSGYDKGSSIPICYYSFGNTFSSGERSILALFGRLFYALKKIKIDSKRRKIQKIIIFVDEGDIAFHPEWQRRIFDSLLKFLTEVYRDFKLQIILSTHSPFILSDIPNSNVVFLKRDEATGKSVVADTTIQGTFAANIHALFANAFFMDSTIGEFASKKIDYAIDKIKKNDKRDFLGVTQIVEIVGDEFIQENLRELMRSRFYNEENINVTISRLKRELREANRLKRKEK